MAKIKKLHQDYEGSSSVVLERVKTQKSNYDNKQQEQ